MRGDDERGSTRIGYREQDVDHARPARAGRAGSSARRPGSAAACPQARARSRRAAPDRRRSPRASYPPDRRVPADRARSRLRRAPQPLPGRRAGVGARRSRARSASGSRLGPWKITATGPGRSAERSPMAGQLIAPDVGVSRPAIRCSSVLLPEPDGPLIAIRAPAATTQLTSRRARVVALPLPNERPTSRHSASRVALTRRNARSRSPARGGRSRPSRSCGSR